MWRNCNKQQIRPDCGPLLIERWIRTVIKNSLTNFRHYLKYCSICSDKVLLGEWDTTTDPDCRTLIAIKECTDPVEKYNIEESIPHPYYTQKNNNNDIGLIRVDRDIVYTGTKARSSMKTNINSIIFQISFVQFVCHPKICLIQNCRLLWLLLDGE